MTPGTALISCTYVSRLDRFVAERASPDVRTAITSCELPCCAKSWESLSETTRASWLAGNTFTSGVENETRKKGSPNVTRIASTASATTTGRRITISARRYHAPLVSVVVDSRLDTE